MAARCGRSSMVEPQSSKLATRVRFPSPAQQKHQVSALLGTRPMITPGSACRLVSPRTPSRRTCSPHAVGPACGWGAEPHRHTSRRGETCQSTSKSRSRASTGASRRTATAVTRQSIIDRTVLPERRAARYRLAAYSWSPGDSVGRAVPRASRRETVTTCSSLPAPASSPCGPRRRRGARRLPAARARAPCLRRRAGPAQVLDPRRRVDDDQRRGAVPARSSSRSPSHPLPSAASAS